MVRTLTVVLMMALVAGACGDDDTSTPSTTRDTPAETTGTTPPATTTPPPQPGGIHTDDRFGQDPAGPAAELAAVREANEGLLDDQTVLDLFAATYGPIPGGDAGRFPPRPEDGSLVLRNAIRIFDRLTPQQQETVLAALGPAPSAPAALEGMAAVEPAIHRPGAFALTDLTALGNAQAEVLAGFLGRSLGIRLEVVSGGGLPAGLNGDAFPYGGGEPDAVPYDTCRVRLLPGLGGEQLMETISHEVYHCFQFTFTDNWPDAPDWIMEGQASWAGVKASAPAGTAEAFQVEWIDGALGSLFTKSYDAQGFYFAMEQAGADVWGALPAMFDVSDEEAVATMGLGPADVVRWMGTTDGRADLGPELPVEAPWRVDATGVPSVGHRGTVTVTPDSPYSEERTMKSYSRYGAWQFTLEGDLAYLTLNSEAGGFEFYPDGDFTQFDGSYMGRFCLREDGCSCETEDGFEEGDDNLVMAVGSASGGGADVMVETEDIKGGFADGHWEGELIATQIVTDTSGAILTGDPLGAPFEFDVVDGVVTGAYSTSMFQDIDAGPDLSARGVGQVSGAVTGCWFSPNLVAALFSFEGTITIDGETRPFVFSQSFDGAESTVTFGDETATGDIGAAPFTRWRFDDTTTDDQASGSLETTPFLDFMRSVGVGVNDVQIRFVATRTG